MTTNQDHSDHPLYHNLAAGVWEREEARSRDRQFEAASTDTELVIAPSAIRIGHVGGKADHALTETGHTLCGAERRGNRWGVGYSTAIASGETTDVRRVTCRTCRTILDNR